MKKKLIVVLLIALVALIALAGCNPNKADYDTEIIKNGDFESFNAQQSEENKSQADNWFIKKGTTENWGRNESNSSEYDAKLGRRYLYLHNTSSGYNYIYQKVRLEKNATYKLTVYINAETLSGSAGVFFEGAVDTVGVVIDEKTEGWQEISEYFTSTVSGEVTLVAAVGRETSNATGKVLFDNISLQKIDGVGDDVTLSVLKMKEGYTMSDGGSITFVILFTLISAGICAGMFFLIKGILKNKEGIHSNDGTKKGDKFLNAMTGRTASFIYVLLGAFILRFIIVLATAEGNDIIMNWISLSKDVASKGIISYYTGATNEPQGIVWIYGLLGFIGKWLNLENVGYSILVRMPMVVADLSVCYMIYGCAAKYQNERTAIVYGFIYAILPVFFVLGSLYGSTQSIAIAFLVAMSVSMLGKKYVSTGIYYTLALMFSNYALILLPVILLYQIYGLVTDKSSIAKTVVTMALCLVVFYLMSLPLCWSEVAKGNVLMVFRKMYAFFDVNYPTLSDNTFNLYGIFAAGGKLRSSNIILNIGNWLFVAGMSAYAIYHYIRTANRLDLILLSGIMLVAYSALGAQGALDIMPIGLALLLLYIIITPDIRLYIGTSALSALSFLNIAQLLSQSGFISGVDNAGTLDFEGKNAFMIIFSILTVAAVFYMLYVTCDITINSYVKPIAKDKDIQQIDSAEA